MSDENPHPDFMTRADLGNGPYPGLQIYWRKQPGVGDHWIGKTKIWIDGNQEMGCEHTVSVGLSWPLGTLHFTFDGSDYCCWQMGHIDSYDLSLRDLQWVTIWSALAIKWLHKVETLREKCKEIVSHDRSTQSTKAIIEAVLLDLGPQSPAPWYIEKALIEAGRLR